MKIPKHIIKKIIKINANALKTKKLSEEVELWLMSQGINADALRQSSISILELAEYGELDTSDISLIETQLLKNIEETVCDDT